SGLGVVVSFSARGRRLPTASGPRSEGCLGSVFICTIADNPSERQRRNNMILERDWKALRLSFYVVRSDDVDDESTVDLVLPRFRDEWLDMLSHVVDIMADTVMSGADATDQDTAVLVELFPIAYPAGERHRLHADVDVTDQLLKRRSKRKAQT